MGIFNIMTTNKKRIILKVDKELVVVMQNLIIEIKKKIGIIKKVVSKNS